MNPMCDADICRLPDEYSKATLRSVPESLELFFAGYVGGVMEKDRPWEPELKTPPLFNPFESSTEWTEQLGANDRIKIDDEEDAEGNVPADPPTRKTDEK